MKQNLKMKAFESYEVEPSPAVWERIAEKLPPPKKRRFILWPWLAAACVAGLGILGSHYLEVDVRLKDSSTGKAVALNQRASFLERKNITTEAQRHRGGKEPSKFENARHGSSPNSTSAFSQNGHAFAIRGEIKGKRTESRDQPKQEMTAASGAGISFAQGDVALLSSLDANVEAGVSLPSSLPTAPVATIRPRPVIGRWQTGLMGSADYSYRRVDFTGPTPPASAMDQGELMSDESGITTPGFGVNAQYSISPRISIQSGISYFATGQQRDKAEIAVSPGNTAGTAVYTLGTSAGNLQGSGKSFDMAYYDNPDSSLAHVAAIANGDVAPANFNLEQQFRFISLPVIAQYQLPERKFTPYFGLGFSMSVRVDEKIYLNNTELDYAYAQDINRILLSAEAQAGVRYNVLPKLSLRVQPSLRYGLNSLSNNDVMRWVPYSMGVGFGISYRY